MDLTKTNIETGVGIDYDVLRDNSLLFDYSALGEFKDTFRDFISDCVDEGEIDADNVDTMTYKILNDSGVANNYTDEDIAYYGYSFTWEEIHSKMSLQPMVIVPKGYVVEWFNRGSGMPFSSGIVTRDISYDGKDCTLSYIKDGVRLIGQIDGDGYKLTITVNKEKNK